jgi:CRISPR system Cascade subunit CasC
MKIELHMIQNFAPACLNRDDTNSPKDCVFGGVRRARISSQCIKRSIRTSFREQQLIAPEHLAHRTNRLGEEVGRRLAAEGKDAQIARVVAQTAIGGLGLGVDEDGQTQYLLFLGESGIAALTDLCRTHWGPLAEIAAKIQAAEAGKSAKTAKDAKKAAKDAVPKEVQESLAAVLDGTKACDLALFGRMLADLPGSNIDAACQVAHALSTHKVEMEMDFFTAVDDLKTDEEDAGAGMMGTIGFNSSCFYRYAVIDDGQLRTNLGGDTDLAAKTIEAFLRASAAAIPTGKQNTFAAHNPPDFILALVRHTGTPVSLANAFVAPARERQREGKDLVQVSVAALGDDWGRLTGVYGTGKIDGPVFCGLTKPAVGPDGWQDAGSFEELIKFVLAAVAAGGQA